MRNVRVIVGILLWTVGLPSLLVGLGLLTAMQHRDANGAFSAPLEEIAAPGQAVVVTDVDALLRREAAFARSGQTRVRITAATAAGPAFVGLAPTEEAGRYPTAVRHVTVSRVSVGKGALPVRVSPVTSAPPAGSFPSAGPPEDEAFWVRSGSGALEWTAEDVRGRQLSLVVMRADAEPVTRVRVTAAVQPDWFATATWGGIAGGLILTVAGATLVAWQVRPRRHGRRMTLRRQQASYVSQPREAKTDRPATLADADANWTAAPVLTRPASQPPVKPTLNWPPLAPSGSDPEPGVAAVPPARSEQSVDAAPVSASSSVGTQRASGTESAVDAEPAAAAGSPKPRPAEVGAVTAPATRTGRRRMTAAGLPLGDLPDAGQTGDTGPFGRGTAERARNSGAGYADQPSPGVQKATSDG